MGYFWAMLVTLFLDANNYGGVVNFFGVALAGVVLLVLLFILWNRSIEQQFDRNPDAEQSNQSGCGMSAIIVVILLLVVLMTLINILY